MMRPFLVLLVWLVAAVPGMAQRGLRMGVLVSGNVSSLNGAEVTYGTEYHPGAGFGGGLTLHYVVRPLLQLRLDVRYDRFAPRAWGMMRDDSNVPRGKSWIRQRYTGITLPLAAQLTLGRHAYLLAGPLAHVLLRQLQVSNGNVWHWPGAEVDVVWDKNTFRRMSVEYPDRLRRLSGGAVAGFGLTFNPTSRAQVFVEMTGSLIRTQALRDGFAWAENNPVPLNPVTDHRLGPPQPHAATLRTLTLTTGLTLGAPGGQASSAD